MCSFNRYYDQRPKHHPRFEWRLGCHYPAAFAPAFEMQIGFIKSMLCRHASKVSPIFDSKQACPVFEIQPTKASKRSTERLLEFQITDRVWLLNTKLGKIEHSSWFDSSTPSNIDEPLQRYPRPKLTTCMEHMHIISGHQPRIKAKGPQFPSSAAIYVNY